MDRPCSGVCCPMNAATCKCTGIQGCDYYTPLYSLQEIAGFLRALANALDAASVQNPAETNQGQTVKE